MAAWPAVTTEERPWVSKYAGRAATAKALRPQREDYLAAVTPEIASLPVVIGAEALAEATEATAAIARFDASLGGEVSPFAAVLLRSESASSSQIEQLTASSWAIAEAELGAREQSSAAQVVGNTRAMIAAINLSSDLSLDTITQMHHALLEHAAPQIAGELRTEQVWIGGSSFGPHGASYVAPHFERVPAALDDLVAFMDRYDLPVLIQAAIAHAQFETIHPFVDGNGRTGRALVHAILQNKNLTQNVSVPISAGLLGDTARYFDALNAYRDGQLEPIVQQFTEASFAAIGNGTAVVEDLRSTRTKWATRITARAGSVAHRVADLLIRQPVINARVTGEALGIETRNAQPGIDHLVDIGILVPANEQRRGRIWRAPEVLNALDDFAARSVRRRAG